MPEPTDKHAAAQQAVDILHEIATILVSEKRNPSSLPPLSLLTNSMFAPLELSPGPTNVIDMHLDDRARRQSRGLGSKNSLLSLSSSSFCCMAIKVLTDLNCVASGERAEARGPGSRTGCTEAVMERRVHPLPQVYRILHTEHLDFILYVLHAI